MTQAEVKAITKAREVAPRVSEAREVGADMRLWLVAGSEGDYVVYQSGKSVHCTCKAGENNIPCYHRAAVFIKRQKAAKKAQPMCKCCERKPALERGLCYVCELRQANSRQRDTAFMVDSTPETFSIYR
jgi:hypothetical protein